MLTYKGFTGINNVLPEHRMGSGDLLLAQDVDIGLTGEVTRRAGLTVVSEQCHKNLHQAHSFMLATCGSALTAIHPDGARHVIHRRWDRAGSGTAICRMAALPIAMG